MNKVKTNSPEERRNVQSECDALAKQRDEQQYEEAIKSLNRMGEREIDRTLAGN